MQIIRNKNVVEELIEIYGNEHRTSIATGHSHTVIHHWRKIGYIPVRWAEDIHKLTHGKISESRIRHWAAHMICGI